MNKIIETFIENSLENQWYPPNSSKQFNVFDSDWPFLQIDFSDDFEEMHQECIDNDHLFVGHRQKDKHLSYSHEGWSALTLHGIRPDATENYDQYGLTEPDYDWTEACVYFPTCVKFLKKLGYGSYDRVRIMKLSPGGYIMPHSDGDGRIFGPLNIAINNPDGCNFYFEKWGKVPFSQGTGFFLDIGNVHAVFNNSDEPRYHFIVHGSINNNLIQTAFDQLKTRKKRVCYGVYNQRNRINNFSMYLRSKGATLFYLNRSRSNVDIICGDEIHEILNEALIKKYEYCVIQSSGCTLKSFDYDKEIRDFINENNFGIAGHILSWPGRWLELHHQFFIVNVSAWKEVGCPEFGDWCSEEQLLPVVERSIENFHDDYTPLWVKYSNKQEYQSNAGQGWKLLSSMFLNDWPVITLSEKLRFNKFYYYPEFNTEKFESSIKTLTPYEGQNWNQVKLINDAKSVKDQIWLFNSESMSINNEGKFNLVVNTASGFKLFDIFKNKKLDLNGKIIVYDFNIKSIQWYKHLHTWKTNDIVECIKSFSEKDYFTWLGKTDHSRFVMDHSFDLSIKELMDHFGGTESFIKYWSDFKKTPTKFVVADLYKESQKFANIFVGPGKKFVNLSNIFSTDATTLLYGHTEVQSCQQRCLASLYVVDPEIEVSICDFWNRNIFGKVKNIL
jgi:hypothetical protein